MDVIDHIAIVVDDIAQSIEWYRDTFDCTLEWQDDSWALIAFANCKLALVLPGQHPPHFAVLCDEPDRFGKPKTHRDGTRSVYCRDADDNFVELLHRPKALPGPVRSQKGKPTTTPIQPGLISNRLGMRLG